MSQKPQSVFKVPVVEQEQTHFAANEETDSGYAAFVSDGFLGLLVWEVLLLTPAHLGWASWRA